MSCTSSAAGSQQPSSTALTPRGSKESSQCCSECNSQIWSSYVVGLLACLLVVGGIFLAFHRWDYLWLAVSAVGVLLILIGASLHYCGGGAGNTSPAVATDAGARPQKRKRGSNHHRIVCELGNQNERLLPSAPPSGISTTSGHNFSVSQLSLNALPPFFQTYDTVSLESQVPNSPTVGPPVSPIMHLNGQSFLLLPIGGSSTEMTSEANSLAHRLSTHLAVLEQQSLVQKRCSEAVNFGLVPCLSSFTAAKDLTQQEQLDFQGAFSPGKAETTVVNEESQVLSESSIAEPAMALPIEEVQQEEEEEPIYQVPRIPSTQATANISHTDPDICNAPVVEHLSITTQSAAQIIATQATVECNTLEDTTCEETRAVDLEDNEEMPNDSSALRDDVTQSNLTCESVEIDQIDQNETNVSMPIVINIEETVVQNEDAVSQECTPNGLTVTPDSRVSTPEPNWTLPPSYDEVAPPNFKRLGHNKFAYETM